MGMALTSPRPNAETARPGAGGQRQAGVVHLDDEPDDAVDQRRDQHGHHQQDDGPGQQALARHLVEGDHHDLGGQDEVGADGGRDHLLLVVGRVGGGRLVRVLGLRLVPGELLPELLRALVTQVGAADHQDRGEQERRELAQDQRDRQDDEQLVAQRSLGDAPDDRELTLRFETLHVPRGHRRVVDHHPGRLDTGPAGAGRDVVQRGGRELDQGRDVVEKGEQSAHRTAARSGHLASSVAPNRAPGRECR